MFHRIILFHFILVLGLSSCGKQVIPDIEVEDNKSQLLAAVMQRTDFDVSVYWEIERVRQNTETPSAENLGLVESSSRGLIGTTTDGKPVIIYNRLTKYIHDVNWSIPIDLAREEDEYPIQVFFPSLGKNTQQICYTNSIILNCKIIVIYDNVVSELRVTIPYDFLTDSKIEFIEPVLLNIDARLTNIK